MRAPAFVLAAAALFVAVPRAHAKDPEPTEPKSLSTVRAAVRMLVTTKAGPTPGTPKAWALPMLVNWAGIAPEWSTSLESSPYTLGPVAKGVVRVVVGEAGATALTIDLVVKDVRREQVREAVTEVGRELGYAMTNGTSDPWTCSGAAATQRELSVGVGVDLVTITVRAPSSASDGRKPAPSSNPAADAAVGLWGGAFASKIEGGVLDSLVLGVDRQKDGASYGAATRADVTLKSEEGEHKVVVTTKYVGKASGDGILFESTERKRTVDDGTPTYLTKAYLRVTPKEGHVLLRVGNDTEGYTEFTLVPRRE